MANKTKALQRSKTCRGLNCTRPVYAQGVCTKHYARLLRTGSLELNRHALRRIDLTGQRFGRLVVLKFVPTHKTKGTYWLCQCDCGKQKTIRGQHLRSGHIVSCRCVNAESTAATCRRNSAQRFNPEATAPKAIYSTYRSSAKGRGLAFSIPFQEFCSLIKRQCFYCGAPPSNQHYKQYKVLPFRYQYNGLDRCDNTKGYVLDNCVPCCARCNIAKQDLTIDEFFAWVTAVYKVRYGQ